MCRRRATADACSRTSWRTSRSSAPGLEAFDRSLKELNERTVEEGLGKFTDDKLKETKSVEEMRKAASILKKMGEEGRVTRGTFDKPQNKAVYDYDGPCGKPQLAPSAAAGRIFRPRTSRTPPPTLTSASRRGAPEFYLDTPRPVS